MKTAIKITALAAVLILAAVSCAPDADFTKMDWGKANDAASPTSTSTAADTAAYRGNGRFVPTIPGTGGTSSDPLTATTGTTNPGILYEFDIRFPAEADFLRKQSIAEIENALKDFMTLYSYTNPAGHSNTPSDRSTGIDYTLMRRTPTTVGSNGFVDITIHLNIPASNFVVKIDSTKYTVKGNKLDRNGDRKPGEEFYDDAYIQVYVDESTNGTFVPPGGPHTSNGYQAWALTLTNVSAFISTTDAHFTQERTVSVATLAPNGININLGTAEYNAVIDEELGALVEKISFEKFDLNDRTWKPVEANIRYFDGTEVLTQPTGVLNPAARSIVLTYTPDALGYYRTVATDIEYLETVKPYQGCIQKIDVTSGIATRAWNDTVVTTPVRTAKDYLSTGTGTGWRFITTQAFINGALMDSAVAGNNITVELFFNPINYGTETTPDSAFVWLKELSTAEFNRNVKILQSGTALTSGNWYTPGTSTYNFIKVKDVSYSRSNYVNQNQQGFNCITLTLEPGQNLEDFQYLLIAPGFQYAHENILFGDHTTTGLARIIDGQNRWGFYEIPDTGPSIHAVVD